MKVIFYRILLKRAENLTPNEKILYSFLVSKSIAKSGWALNAKSGKFDKQAMSHFFRNFGNYIGMCDINHSKTARELHLSRMSIFNGFRKLEKFGYIKYDQRGGFWRVFVNWELLNGGYFELSRLDEVSGELALFYAYLLSKGERFNYCIDTWKTKMAEDMGITKVAITNLLNRLYKLGLAKRLDDGRLFIKHEKIGEQDDNQLPEQPITKSKNYEETSQIYRRKYALPVMRAGI